MAKIHAARECKRSSRQVTATGRDRQQLAARSEQACSDERNENPFLYSGAPQRNSPMPPRQLLVCATVRRMRRAASQDGQDSHRFVPVSEFGLWQYAMFNRHGLEVASAEVGVWMPDDEWQRHMSVFKNGQSPLPVDRVDVSLFDEHLGICHLVRRFAQRTDLPALNQRLAQHLGPGDFRPEVSEGMFTGARPVTDLRRLARPMAAFADDLLATQLLEV